MKRILALCLTVVLSLCLFSAAQAVNEDVEGKIVIASSMYQFVLDHMGGISGMKIPDQSEATHGNE